MYGGRGVVCLGFGFLEFIYAFPANSDFGVAVSMQLCAGAQQLKAAPAASGEQAGTPGG